ncbi:MAG: glycoside hydrolase family 38 C-terminal domain-containing protein [Clostridia bacterium]|nr:glycoside hydrolase family 38 C-terminal domain-containing protein [Clostridia bacterium]
MKKIYMIGNTHFDPVWLWRWDEAMSSITATFRSALERMKEYDDFTYSFSAPAVFEWIKNTDSELFEQIKQRIEEGRWELCEGWWLQADCNSALGESYVRQGLYAQKYFEKNFGKKSKTVFNIDSFGHPKTLPQILVGCDIENYVFWRPNEEHKTIETPLFNWVGENNSIIKTYRIGGDGGEIFTADITSDTLDPVIDNMENIPHDIMIVYGVTDHGGAPTKDMIEKTIKKKEEIKGRYDLKFGRVDEFFENADMEKLPYTEDELQVKFIGPYSNFTEIKKNNRCAEYAVMNAEKVSVIACELVNKEYPAEKLRKCWEDLMFNQFHDILGGCCIEDAYFDARNLHGRVMQSANETVHFGLQSITNKIKMPGKNPDNAWNLVVWNLNGFEADTEIEAEVQWAWEFEWYDGGITLFDEEGRKIQCQIINELSVIPKFRSRFVFKAKIPALGYKTFIVKQTKKKVLNDNNGLVENDRFKIEYDQSGIRSIFDKIKDKTVITSFLKPYVVLDLCDTWGFNKTVYESQKNFLNLKECKITESGSIRTTLRQVWEYNKSTVIQDISLYGDHIDCKYRVLWNEEKTALKFEISNGHKIKTRVSAPYGCVDREESEFEKPMGEWITLYNDSEEMTVLCDSVFAYGFDGTAVNLTVLRNCIFGDLRTEPLDETKDYKYMGQGITEGKIRIVFDKNEDREGILFNNPPVILCEANHDGIFAPQNSFFSTDENTVLTALKKAEDCDKYVIRLYNTAKSEKKANVRLFENSAEIICNGHEIKSLLTDKKGFKCTNMLEEEV